MTRSQIHRLETPTLEQLHGFNDADLHYLAESQLAVIENRLPLSVDDFDLDVVNGVHIALHRRHNLEYAARTELEVVQTAQDVSTLLHGIDPNSFLGRFFYNWRGEEPMHGSLINSLIRSVNTKVPDKLFLIEADELEPHNNNHRVHSLSTLIPQLRDGVRLAYLWLGYTHESTTQAKYRQDTAFFREAGEKNAARIIGAIAGQEPAHKYLYATLAEMYFRRASGLAWTIGRSIVMNTFSPVGANSLEQKVEFARLAMESGLEPEHISDSLRDQVLLLLRISHLHAKADFILDAVRECFTIEAKQATNFSSQNSVVAA